MKTAIILISIIILLTIIISVTRFFKRLEKPVNKDLSDSYYYHARKDIIVYSPMGNWFELGYTETTADRESFQVLSREFGKDKQTVFWKGEPQAVDYTTFRIDEFGIAKDAKHVYYTNSIGKKIAIISGADPKTYRPYRLPQETYNQSWGRDHQFVFLYGNKVDVDGKTFVRINQSLGHDSRYYYSVVYNSGLAEDNTRVIKQDTYPGGQAEPVNDFYARVNNSIIHSNWKNEFSAISFQSVDTIRIIDERHLVVNDSLLRDGTLLPDVDVATLEIIARDFMKDKFNVYFDTEKIAGADPATFSFVFENYSKDIQHVYYKTGILPGVNPQKLTVNYSNNTVSDGTLIFNDGARIN